MDLTNNQIHVLQHSLGITDPYAETEYRNHYVASEGHYSWNDLQTLVGHGLMREVRNPIPMGCSKTFVVTEAGKVAARKHKQKPSRAKRRYHNYLSVSDTCPDLTFREFLTSPHYAEYR